MKKFLIALLTLCTTALFGQNQDFAFSLYNLAKEESDTPLFSSYSIATICKMLEEGADGTTYDEFAALNLSYPMPIAGIEHKVAGFLDHRLSLYESFSQMLTDHFDATWYPTEFREKKQAALTINNWLESTSNPPLFSEDFINPMTRLVLISALNINASFEHAFNKSATHEAPFYNTQTQVGTATFMNQTKTLPYFEDDLAQVVSLPLKNSSMALVLMLPKEENIPTLDLDKLEPTYLNLTIPKWKISSNKELNGWLQKLGIQQAFTPYANFSKIAGSPLTLSKVIHHATFDVHEEGLSATSATIAIMGLMSCRPPAQEPLTITFDRPFLYFLIDTPTQEILFMGRYVAKL